MKEYMSSVKLLFRSHDSYLSSMNEKQLISQFSFHESHEITSVSVGFLSYRIAAFLNPVFFYTTDAYTADTRLTSQLCIASLGVDVTSLSLPSRPPRAISQCFPHSYLLPSPNSSFSHPPLSLYHFFYLTTPSNSEVSLGSSSLSTPSLRHRTFP